MQDKQALTRSAFLWTSILRTPFWAIYNLLLFILYKDLHATPLQIALFIALKPVASIFSVYWSSYVNKRPDRLRANVIWAGILGHLPFLFFPVCYGANFVLFASAIYMMMFRGVIPAWMEIFKLNLKGSSREKVFSYGSTFSYLGGGLLPIVMGGLLDEFSLIWRWIFSFTAQLAILAAFFQAKIPIPLKQDTHIHVLPKLKEQFLAPWKNAWDLMRKRLDFRFFQVGFMLGGFGLMVMQPALPVFFIDALGLSYTELAIALTLCKGIGFALASPLAAKFMHQMNIYRFSGIVTLLAAVFPIILITAQFQIMWVYIAYLFYGVMQAGSELSWHLSGPLFSKEEDSSTYSSVNVLTVGLRGCIGPYLGSLFCLLYEPTTVLLIGGVFCCAATLWMLSSVKKSQNLLNRTG